MLYLKCLSKMSKEHRSIIKDVDVEGKKIKKAGENVGLKRVAASTAWKRAQIRFANLTRRYYVSEGRVR